MGQCVEIRRACAVAHPQPFLTCGFETGIVTLTLRPQGVSPLEIETAAVNGKSVIVWNGLVFRAAPVFLAVVPVFMVARANTGLGLAERTAVFLAGTMIVGGLAVLVHGKACLADRIAGRKRFQNLRTTRIEGNKCLALIDRFHGVVDAFRVVALVGKEGAFLQRNRLIRGREDLSGDGKWAQEFDLSSFPGFAEHLEKASAPIEHSCRTTEFITLPGTTEQAILLTVPMIGADGTVYGLCGFSVNQTYFLAHHAQPTGIGSLACVLSDAAEGLDVQKGLLTYPAGSFCFVPDELLSERSLRGGLTAFVGSELSFVSISEPFTVASGDAKPHDLTVLIPKSDYDRTLLKSRLEAGALLLLLVSFAAACCLFYTRRYLRPILRDIERLKDESGGAQMTFDELQPVSAKLQFHEQTITDLETEKQAAHERADHFRFRAEQLQSENSDLQEQVEGAQERLSASQEEVNRLAYLRKKELDPAVYENFLRGYAMLTDTEREVCDALSKGLSTREFAEQTERKPSTVETHRKNSYRKLSIHSVKELQLCLTLMRMEQQEAETQKE